MPACTSLAGRLHCSGGGRRVAVALTAAAAGLAAAALLLALVSSPRCGILPCVLLSGRGSAGLSPRTETGPALEVVISHYNAPLGWVAEMLERLPANGTQLTVYSKGPKPPPGALPLPNVGREAHTYLHHLAHRYDSLAEVTLMMMGSTPQHPGDRLGDLLRHWRRARRTGFFCAGMSRMDPPPFAFQLDSWQGITDDPAAAHRSDAERGARGAPLVRATPRPMGAWWAEHVAGPMPRAMCTNAVLAVHRDRVRLRPRSFYATLLKQFSAGPNLEASHYMERGWAALLYAPEALAGCQRG